MGPIADRLVTCGGAHVDRHWKGFLTQLGVAACDGDSDWIWPTQYFLRDALPAQDQTDLVRRIVIRDPQYRLHVDLCLCSVIHSVALAERWTRLEDLIFGVCKPAMPRVAQLSQWWSRTRLMSIRDLPGHEWEVATRGIADPAFKGWDQFVWGENRGPADLFPLLQDLYLPLLVSPCFVGSDSPANKTLICNLIAAAKDDEALRLPIACLKELVQLQAYGLPVRITDLSNETSVTANLVGCVQIVSDREDRLGERSNASELIPSSARRSCILEKPSEPLRWSVVTAATSGVLAIVSIDLDAVRWPNDSVASAPRWLPLPGAEVLASAAKRRVDSPNADISLLHLANHPLYGFLLQLFLLEALDRELGEETLALGLPQNRRLETVNDWAETKVLYRPREIKEQTAGEEASGFLVLGTLDQVLPQLAHESGILGIATPYVTDVPPWSRAIYLLSTAGVIDGRPDRWILTITPFVLDRLHSGTLMKEVIRGGREIRKQMHDVLITLWKEQVINAKKEHVFA